MGTKEVSLTLLGTGTSQGVPVIGCDCAVCRSSDPRDRRLRMSALLRNGEGRIAIDAGPDFRGQMLGSRTNRLDGILLTHEHNDHTAGLDDLRPFCFKQGIDMPIYALPRVAKEVRQRFAYSFTNYPGVPRLDLREISFGDTLELIGLDVKLLRVEHGALSIFGFRVGDLAYLTDVKQLPAETLAELDGLHTLVISALNHRGTHSHLSLEESLTYAEEIGAERTVLIHLSHRMGRTAEVNAGLPRGVELGWDGMALPIS